MKRVIGTHIARGPILWGLADEFGIKSGFCHSSSGLPLGNPLFTLRHASDSGYILTCGWKNIVENHLTEFDANIRAHHLVEQICQQIDDARETKLKLATHYQRAEAVHVASIIVSFIAGIGFTVILALLF